jgi:hypothetical protein
MKLVEPTDKALEAFKVTWKKTRGALPTRAATGFLLTKLKKLPGWIWLPEGRLGDKPVDLLGRDPQNRVVTVEIAHSDGHEVHNALHCLKFPDVKSHVVVTTTKIVAAKLKKRMAKMPELEANPRLEILPLSTALTDQWSP